MSGQYRDADTPGLDRQGRGFCGAEWLTQHGRNSCGPMWRSGDVFVRRHAKEHSKTRVVVRISTARLQDRCAIEGVLEQCKI